MDGPVLLSDRGVIAVAGADARRLLHDLVTADVADLAPGQARFAALLSPQGKILYDFFVFCEADEAFFIDVAAAKAAELAKRLVFYRLRAKAEISDRSGEMGVGVDWNGEGGFGIVDPRLEALGRRGVASKDGFAEFSDGSESWRVHRIGLGVPEAGSDFPFGDAFPHEACMDQLNGVDFAKGCYVGQEVVSRMHHRGTARTRIVPVRLEGAAESGTDILAGDMSIGRLGGVAGDRGLAMIRLDRAADALAEGRAIKAGEAVLTLVKPTWARFPFPGDPDFGRRTAS